MRVYISGPITGVKNFEENFKKAAERMAKNGHKVVNPAAVNDVFLDGTYEEYMQINLSLLAMCDAIYMMKGWQQSKGANREYGFAKAAGMTILEE